MACGRSNIAKVESPIGCCEQSYRARSMVLGSHINQSYYIKNGSEVQERIMTMNAVNTSALMEQLTEKFNTAIRDEEFTNDTSKITKAITGLTYVTKEHRRRKQLSTTVRKQLAVERDKEFKASGIYRPVEEHEVLARVEEKLKTDN